MDNYNKLNTRLRKLVLITASIGFFTPFILWHLEGTAHPRHSISNYAYSEYNYVFVALLMVSAMSYIVEGVYHRDKWYQIVIGTALAGVALTPHLDFPLWHYTLTAIFFIGGSAVMVIYSSKKQRLLMWLFAILMTSGIVLSFFLKLFPVFYGELIGFLPMIIVKFGEEFKIIK